MAHRGFFRNSRGLRQCDPLSPYLFVLGMDVSSYLINNAVEGNFMSRCKFGNRGEGEEELVLSHLLYADDTLLFCKAIPDQLTHLRWILMWFDALSGLRINLTKSEIFLAEGIENVEDLVAELGVQGWLSSLHVFGPQHKSAGVWNPIEERFRKRLFWQLLVWDGFFLSQFVRPFFLVGKEPEWEKRIKKFGGWHSFASFGQFGAKGIE